MKTPFCDEKRPYIHLTIDQAGQSGRSDRLPVPHSDAGKGGITGWSAITGLPICAIPGTHYEDFNDAGPQFAGEDPFACKSSEATFRVQMYDQDDGADDLHLNHAFTVDLSDPDDPLLEACHDAGDNGKVCWRITVSQSDDTQRDSDGDGLVDFEETYGADRDCDGQLVSGQDLFLPEMGVDPSHKDMLVEMNWFTGFEPALAELEEVQYIFGEAPVSAGGLNNPDGELGVNLIIDAGHVLNNVGLHQAGGRDLGTSAESPTSSEELQELVAQIELLPRVGYFRNIVFGPLYSDGMPMDTIAGRSVGNDRIQIEDPGAGTIFHELGHSLSLLHGGERSMSPDSAWPAFTLVDANGDGSIDEADLDEDGVNEARAADINDDGVWDAWALDEDGDGIFESLDRFLAGQNCKPNHLSSMNYVYGPGISYETGGVVGYFDDFSPSKIPDALITTTPSGCPSDNPTCNRRIPLLPDLLEYQLDEGIPVVDSVPSDGIMYRHTFRFYDPSGKLVQGTWLDTAQDWDNNPMTTLTAPTFFAGNIDVDASAPNEPRSQTCGAINNAELQRLVNHDEWSKIVLPPVRGVSAESQASNTYFEDRHAPPSRVNRELWRAEAITCDLSVDAYLQPEYVNVGQSASFVVEVANLGPGPASDGSVSIELPAGVTAATVPADCSPQQGRAGRYDCSTALQGAYGLSALPAGRHIQFVFGLAVAPNASGGQRDI
ncbi:MAG TPA: hypothetical protein VN764_15125, partial [Polyangiaceae bacterium]|nr:hypothetical protein [Polyangiaceae bacterium]